MFLPHISSTVEEPLPGANPPTSIIIVGSGVFGLTTALSLSHRPDYKNATITIIDKSPFPAPDGSSIDSSRIVRADYSDEVYAKLAAEALDVWRLPEEEDDDRAKTASGSIYAGVGGQGRYSESGLILVSDGDSDYVKKSYQNVKSQFEAAGTDGLAFLPDEKAIKQAMKTGGSSGAEGYINPHSGWANAEAAMVWVREQCSKRENIKMITAEVKMIWVTAGKRVEGVILDRGDMLSADLTVIAAGAWSSGLLDLTGIATSTGQIMAYVDVSPEEEETLKDIPVTLNLTNGIFIFPPKNGTMKIARHAYGYVNTIELDRLDGSGKMVISRPVTAVSNPGVRIPLSDEEILKTALGEMVPGFGGRDFSKTRLCWYTDTPTGDFLVSYHPKLERLFVATGGSGHAFKFLPVLGEKVADAIEGKLDEQLKDLWRFRDAVEGPIVTKDGSRNGVERAELMVLLNGG